VAKILTTELLENKGAVSSARALHVFLIIIMIECNFLF